MAKLAARLGLPADADLAGLARQVLGGSGGAGLRPPAAAGQARASRQPDAPAGASTNPVSPDSLDGAGGRSDQVAVGRRAQAPQRAQTEAMARDINKVLASSMGRGDARGGVSPTLKGSLEGATVRAGTRPARQRVASHPRGGLCLDAGWQFGRGLAG